MNSNAINFNSPFNQLLILEERVRLSGATLPKVVDTRAQWVGVRSTIDGLRCILLLDEVCEVLDKRRLTPIPGCAPWIRGAINLRGRLLPVFCVADFFASPEDFRPREAGSQIVVVECPGTFCGILVEKVFGMQKFYEEDFTPVDRSVGGEQPGRIGDFITTSTVIDEQPWYRLDLLALAGEMGKADPGRSDVLLWEQPRQDMDAPAHAANAC